MNKLHISPHSSIVCMRSAKVELRSELVRIWLSLKSKTSLYVRKEKVLTAWKYLYWSGYLAKKVIIASNSA